MSIAGWPVVRAETILMFQKRPCVIVGQQKFRHRNPAYGYYDVNVIRFLDGEQPGTMKVARGKFKTAAKRPPAVQQAYWCRVDQMVALGKAPDVARREAMAAEVAGDGSQQKLLEW